MGTVELLTFGGGHRGYRQAAYRVGYAARREELFDVVIDLTDRDLFRHHPEFTSRHGGILRAAVRGYGYWIWKPYLIGHRLRQAEDEFVAYVDAGCVLNLSCDASRARVTEYLEIARTHGLCVMHLEHDERTWCKGDTFERLAVPEQHRNSRQVLSTVVIAHNSSRSRDLVDDWLQICTEDDYRYVNDDPSHAPNDPSFIEHRHDQAILSCLTKAAGIPSIPDETWFWPDWSTRGRDYPFWASRQIDHTPDP